MVCRLCLVKISKDVAVPLYASDEDSTQTEIIKMIVKYLHLEITSEDEISTSICQDCCERLEDFHRFWTLVDQKQKTLRQQRPYEFLAVKCEEAVDDIAIANENPISFEQLQQIDDVLVDDNLVEVKMVTVEEKIDTSLLNVEEPSLEEDNLFDDGGRVTSSDDEEPLAMWKIKNQQKKLNRKRNVTQKPKKEAKKKKCKPKEMSDKTEKIKLVLAENKEIVENFELNCPLCKENVDNYDALIKHFKLQHKKKEVFAQCCGRTFKQRTRLAEHIRWHRNPDQFKCTICNKVFCSMKYLKKHMLIRHEDVRTAEKCPMCEKKFRSRICLDKHIQRHNSEQKFEHDCHLCGKSFVSSQRLKQHFQGTHDQVYPYKCSACDEPFNFKADLESHFSDCKNKSISEKIEAGEADEEQDQAKECICKICYKIFVNHHRLRKHVESIHQNIHPYVCDQCGKKFKFKPAFENHLLLHDGIVAPPAQCEICGNWLKNKNSLRLHMYRHDNVTNTCHLCGRICPTRRALRGHIKNVHRHEKDYNCKYCEKSFKSPKNLEEHMATHTGAQLYSCPHCPKETRSSSNMYMHIKRMHVEEWIKSKIARSHNPNIQISKN